MRTRFDEQLQQLNREMIRMGALCEQAIAVAAKALLDEVAGMNLAELLIVSKCLVEESGEPDAGAVTGQGANYPGLSITVQEAPGTKCPRCWTHSVQADPETGLCPRCAAVLAAEQ